jgi:hypothetical protein
VTQASYLYAVTGALSPEALHDVRGIGGAPVRAVAAGEVNCVVSSVARSEFGEEPLRRNLERFDWLERVAREHDAVVSAASRLTPTLPLRLATVYRDDESAAARISERESAALAALARVAGREEWGVKVFAVPAPEPVSATARPSSGADYLRQRRAQLETQMSAGEAGRLDATTVFDELATLAVDARRHRPQDPQLSGNPQPMLLNAAYLVDRDRVSDFRAAVERVAAQRPPGAVVVTGPWPPYSFVEWDSP